MKSGSNFEQSFNAQAAVGAMLIAGQYVTDAPNDKEQLALGLDSISPVVGRGDKALVDTGYYSEKAVSEADSHQSLCQK